MRNHRSGQHCSPFHHSILLEVESWRYVGEDVQCRQGRFSSPRYSSPWSGETGAEAAGMTQAGTTAEFSPSCTTKEREKMMKKKKRWFFLEHNTEQATSVITVKRIKKERKKGSVCHTVKFATLVVVCKPAVRPPRFPPQSASLAPTRMFVRSEARTIPSFACRATGGGEKKTAKKNRNAGPGHCSAVSASLSISPPPLRSFLSSLFLLSFSPCFVTGHLLLFVS